MLLLLLGGGGARGAGLVLNSWQEPSLFNTLLQCPVAVRSKEPRAAPGCSSSFTCSGDFFHKITQSCRFSTHHLMDRRRSMRCLNPPNQAFSRMLKKHTCMFVFWSDRPLISGITEQKTNQNFIRARYSPSVITDIKEHTLCIF